MIKVGVTNDYKSITQNLNCNSPWVDSIQVIFDADCPQKLLNDLHENPVDVLFASHHLIHCITVAFYGQLKDCFPDIRIVIFDLFDQEKIRFNLSNSGTQKEFDRTKNLLVRTAKEIFIGPHIVFDENHDPQGFLEKLKLFRQGKYTFNDIVYISLREKYVIKLAAKELCAKEIAEELNISLRTVEVHKRNLMSKTNSKNFIGVILYALINRVMTLEELYD
ncbi:response regulator transcription factor [Chryseobacterium sp. CFBP8996]|uniref:response regulator transcription factor n=1 Tax=Chryseobacterium sp. CFBP8996 TaxID=3096529 RepID=UPI002A6B0865|nr:LuxR C-terminal-related transcriptional regulator [Chryseobacterium sp. CFBP8996]MDY0931936.1 LuxR C-terminal-related transcriptional regulator [Chryseobacterium sp. CFBP8996]